MTTGKMEAQVPLTFSRLALLSYLAKDETHYSESFKYGIFDKIMLLENYKGSII